MTTHNCPDCRCSVGEPIPRPSTSSTWARTAALESAKAAVRAAREKRTSNTGDGEGTA